MTVGLYIDIIDAREGLVVYEESCNIFTGFFSLGFFSPEPFFLPDDFDSFFNFSALLRAFFTFSCKPDKSFKSTSKKVSYISLNTQGAFPSAKPAEKCVTFIGEKKATYCPSNLSGNVFNQYSLEDLKNGKISSVLGIVDLVKLPDDYSDMRSLLGYCKEFFPNHNLPIIPSVTPP